MEKLFSTPPMMDDIRNFHVKFGVEGPKVPDLRDLELFQFRMNFMQEELDEFHTAWVAGDMVKAFDALIDLMYVTLGTGYMMCFPMGEGWELVHAANMKKVRAASAEESAASTGRGSKLDVIKPKGWVSPEESLRELLISYGAQLAARTANATG